MVTKTSRFTCYNKQKNPRLNTQTLQIHTEPTNPQTSPHQEFNVLSRVSRINQGFWHSEIIYYETTKRELNKRLIYECRCDERLKSKDERSTHLTLWHGGLEHVKIETRDMMGVHDSMLESHHLPYVSHLCVYLYPNKKGRRPRVKNVTLKLWGIRKPD